MAKVITFNGRQIVEPGSYSRIIGGETNPPDTATFGNALILDLGQGAGFGFGSGINGDFESGNKSIFQFLNLDDFRTAIRGGIYWDLAKWLFKPSRDVGIKGIDSLFLVRAATTTKAAFSYVWVGGGANGGTFEVEARSEGTGANGVINGTSGDLERGFAMNMIAGIIDTAKFIVEFKVGTFRGLDTNGVPFNNIAAEDTVSETIVRSIEFNDIADLIAWATDDAVFQSFFALGAATAVAGTGVVDAADLAANTGLKVFVGGTESYGAADLTKVFANIKELDYTFILADKFGDDAEDLENSQILAHFITESEFSQRFLVIGGGFDETKFTQALGSLPAAAVYDSELVHVVHSGTKKAIPTGSGFREYPSIYHAASVLGRMAGGEPQDPVTWKDLDWDGVVHELNLSEREQAIQAGVVHMRDVPDLGLVINQDINSLQNNEQDIFEDGTSPHGSIMRIAALLNKELTKNTRVRFVGQNVNTASPADVKAFVEGFLQFRTATKTDDNLILSFKNVNVSLAGSDYTITYGFVPNGPINRLFITGFMFNVNLTA